jgi:hypothetical protein
MLPKQNKMMLLFLSGKNSLWHQLLAPADRKKENIRNLMGIGHGTPGNWRKGNEIKISTAEDVFKATKENIDKRIEDAEAREKANDTVDAFREAYLSENKTIYEVAKLLSISTDDSQKIIDEALYHHLPVFLSMYYQKKDENCTTHFNAFKGLYHVLVERDGRWMKCPMRVRYPIEIGEGVALRCKMNAPKENAVKEREYWEYDGFLIVKPPHLYWIFERRKPEEVDFFFFITRYGQVFQKRKTFSGFYLTTGQDALQSIRTGEIFLQRAESEDEAEITSQMHSFAEVVRSEQEVEAIRQLLKDFLEFQAKG